MNAQNATIAGQSTDPNAADDADGSQLFSFYYTRDTPTDYPGPQYGIYKFRSNGGTVSISMTGTTGDASVETHIRSAASSSYAPQLLPKRDINVKASVTPNAPTDTKTLPSHTTTPVRDSIAMNPQNDFVSFYVTISGKNDWSHTGNGNATFSTPKVDVALDPVELSTVENSIVRHPVYDHREVFLFELLLKLLGKIPSIIWMKVFISCCS